MRPNRLLKQLPGQNGFLWPLASLPDRALLGPEVVCVRVDATDDASFCWVCRHPTILSWATRPCFCAEGCRDRTVVGPDGHALLGSRQHLRGKASPQGVPG